MKLLEKRLGDLEREAGLAGQARIRIVVINMDPTLTKGEVDEAASRYLANCPEEWTRKSVLFITVRRGEHGSAQAVDPASESEAAN